MRIKILEPSIFLLLLFANCRSNKSIDFHSFYYVERCPYCRLYLKADSSYFWDFRMSGESYGKWRISKEGDTIFLNSKYQERNIFKPILVESSKTVQRDSTTVIMTLLDGKIPFVSSLILGRDSVHLSDTFDWLDYVYSQPININKKSGYKYAKILIPHYESTLSDIFQISFESDTVNIKYDYIPNKRYFHFFSDKGFLLNRKTRTMKELDSL